MFDIGLSEILIVAIVALVVLGPERLPKAARLAGFWVRKARSQWYAVKAELESEIQDEELKRSLKESMADLQQTLNVHQESLLNEMQALDSDLQKQHESLRADMQSMDADLQSSVTAAEDQATTVSKVESPTDTENSPRT